MITSLNDIINTLYGVKTTFVENPEVATVGTVATKILNNNPRRIAATIVNLSANALYVAPSNAVSSTRGIYIAPNGGSLTLKMLDDLQMVAVEWYAIASGAASAIYVFETVMYS